MPGDDEGYVKKTNECRKLLNEFKVPVAR